MNVVNDEVLAAFDVLDRTLARYEDESRSMRERIAYIKAERGKGRSYCDIVETEPRPLVVEMLSANAMALDRIGARVRRAQAQALHQEGATMEWIARHFGVTRQRISALVRAGRH